MQEIRRFQKNARKWNSGHAIVKWNEKTNRKNRKKTWILKPKECPSKLFWFTTVMVQLHFKTKLEKFLILNEIGTRSLASSRPVMRFGPFFLFKFLSDIVICSPHSNGLIIRTGSQLLQVRRLLNFQVKNKHSAHHIVRPRHSWNF